MEIYWIVLIAILIWIGIKEDPSTTTREVQAIIKSHFGDDIEKIMEWAYGENWRNEPLSDWRLINKNIGKNLLRGDMLFTDCLVLLKEEYYNKNDRN